MVINYINVFWRDCVPTGSREKNCYQASVNPEFGSTLARRLNQSCFPTVLQSNQTTTKFGTAEARRLNWALDSPDRSNYQGIFVMKVVIVFVLLLWLIKLI